MQTRISMRWRMRARPGFTLVEMMLAVAIMLIVFAIAVPFFRVQLQAMDGHAGRFDAQQNARFGVSTIDRELRVAGAGLPDKQPMIVQAGPNMITFNADLATSVQSAATYNAVYFDPDLPSSATVSMKTTGKVTLPQSSILYPDSNYFQGPVTSYAETISFWVAADTAADAQSGTYALYRRVNNLPATVVARNLVMRAGDPAPFRYMILNDQGTPTEIAASRLPLYHTAIHGSPLDTAKSALTDSIRLVKVHLVGRSISMVKKDTAYRPVDMSIRLLNAGLLKYATCGESPVFGKTVTATFVVGSSPSAVTISFAAALDEASGEKDVERYAIFRRASTETSFGEPIASIPAGAPSYLYTDLPPNSGTWVYAVAAQDCGGQLSSLSTAASVVVP